MNDTLRAAPRLSVVIPTYRRSRVLIATLHNLVALDPAPLEVLVLDQSERHTPETASALRSMAATSRIRWIRDLSPCIPCAMNHGLLEACGEVVLFLDDDILPDPGLVEAHRKAHRVRPGDIVAGRVLQPWHRGEPDPPDRQAFGFNSPDTREVDEFMGGNFSLPREAALEIGGFDENFVRVAYRFEAEFAVRWRKSGRRIRYEPSALIHHLKVTEGGTRTFGEHLTTTRPDHSVGAYYYLFRTQPLGKSLVAALGRLFGSIKSRHHLNKPWWIPLTLIAELRGLAWAGILAIRPPRRLTGRTGRKDGRKPAVAGGQDSTQ